MTVADLIRELQAMPLQKRVAVLMSSHYGHVEHASGERMHGVVCLDLTSVQAVDEVRCEGAFILIRGGAQL